jgi:hypothetical protein
MMRARGPPPCPRHTKVSTSYQRLTPASRGAQGQGRPAWEGACLVAWMSREQGQKFSSEALEMVVHTLAHTHTQLY